MKDRLEAGGYLEPAYLVKKYKADISRSIWTDFSDLS